MCYTKLKTATLLLSLLSVELKNDLPPSHFYRTTFAFCSLCLSVQAIIQNDTILNKFKVAGGLVYNF